jgi:hypothetical protein
MIVAAREFTSAAEMRAAAAAVHARCFNPKPLRMIASLTIEEESAIATLTLVRRREVGPAWKQEATFFDAHTDQHRSRLVEIAMNPARVHVKDRCRELGASYEAIIGGGRRRKNIQVRHLLMWEVHERFGLSFPAIGRLFGGRDHTTCLYAIRKIEAQRGEA